MKLLRLLRYNILVNKFSAMSGRNHCFLGINQYSGELMYLAQGQSPVDLAGIEPRDTGNHPSHQIIVLCYLRVMNTVQGK